MPQPIQPYSNPGYPLQQFYPQQAQNYPPEQSYSQPPAPSSMYPQNFGAQPGGNFPGSAAQSMYPSPPTHGTYPQNNILANPGNYPQGLNTPPSIYPPQTGCGIYPQIPVNEHPTQQAGYSMQATAPQPSMQSPHHPYGGGMQGQQQFPNSVYSEGHAAAPVKRVC